jgi:hypothetical protein
MAPQGFAELAAPSRSRAGGAEKWHKVAVFGAFFQHPDTM